MVDGVIMGIWVTRTRRRMVSTIDAAAGGPPSPERRTALARAVRRGPLPVDPLAGMLAAWAVSLRRLQRRVALLEESTL